VSPLGYTDRNIDIVIHLLVMTNILTRSHEDTEIHPNEIGGFLKISVSSWLRVRTCFVSINRQRHVMSGIYRALLH